MKNESTQPATTENILTDGQAAALLSIESRTLRLWRKSRGLPHIRISSRVIRYRRSDIEEWLARRRVAIAA
ncbi:MAG TPA: helix-turn-helix domain-containing protein [Verrucomicrobiae bacterium]|nr:helix-turn-helix domain-containing protein [Verrucomicrobiae bacterium]